MTKKMTLLLGLHVSEGIYIIKTYFENILLQG